MIVVAAAAVVGGGGAVGVGGGVPWAIPSTAMCVFTRRCVAVVTVGVYVCVARAGFVLVSVRASAFVDLLFFAAPQKHFSDPALVYQTIEQNKEAIRWTEETMRASEKTEL